MQRYALIDSTNTVWTVVEANDDFEVEGYVKEPVDGTVGAGDTWDGKIFTRPSEPLATATLGQLVDIALQLGSIHVEDLAAILPFTKDEVTQDPDGSLVVRQEKIESVIDDAIQKGAVPPKDIPPTLDATAIAVAVEAIEVEVEVKF